MKLPITSTLLLGFGGLVAIAVGTVMLISIRAAQENTDQLLQQTATQRLDAAIARVDRYLTPVADDVEFLALQLSRPGVDLGDDERIETLMRGSLGAAPQIAALAFIRADLSTVRTRRDREHGQIDSPSGSIANRSYAPELIEAAKRLSGVGWNDVFYVHELGVSFISAMAPVRRGGKFAGAFLAAVPVPQLSHLIDYGDPGGTMFILNAKDGVVAHPLLAHGSFKPTASHFQPGRLELADPVLQALWSPEASTSRLGTRLAGTSNWVRRVELGGKAYVVLLRLVKDFSVQPWIVGIYFPTTEVMGPITRLRLAVAVGLVTLACGVALALLLGRALARPIRRLALAAEAVSAFDFSGLRVIGSSPLRELDSAGRAWDSMLTALRWFETYVPKALVGRLLHESADGELMAEERDVTVMFTDIAGFSKIAHGRSPVALGGFLNRHFALLGREVEAQGGTIDKYIGDSIMAFWGAPALDAKHAEHAARAALAAAEALAADNRRRAKKGLFPVRLRIGLHSGPAIVGNVGAPGRVNYTIIGDTVNAAQRLEQLGKEFDDGTADCIVLASAAMVDKLPADIPRRALGEQSLRGIGSFKVYRLG